MTLLKTYQIYYKPEQTRDLEVWTEPYFNKDCTMFFENSVIEDLVLKDTDSEYIGVVSYNLRKKMKRVGDMIPTMRASFDPGLFMKILQDESPDAMGFYTLPPHDIVKHGSKMHKYLYVYLSNVLQFIGYGKKSFETQCPIYCNHFVAKSEWYKRYVTEMLKPAMDLMASSGHFPLVDSGYYKKLPPELAEKFGFDHYPYHPFICERLFNYFATIHNLKLTSY